MGVQVAVPCFDLCELWIDCAAVEGDEETAVVLVAMWYCWNMATLSFIS